MRSDQFIEIFLQPGEYYYGDSATRVRTLLGSCVAMTMWHPLKSEGGMCHCLLPASKRGPAELDGRYIEDALLMFLRDAVSKGNNPLDYEIKLFGGGDMFPSLKKSGNPGVGERNAIRLRELLNKLQLPVKAEHLGGLGHRVIILDVWNGHTYLKHMPLAASEPPAASVSTVGVGVKRTSINNESMAALR